ncbi:hypothetical protein F4777DRAFT_274858 [Nemania sp. FL0916]|nr:hypothetical protein F4777DRAFT_274858 [Nemania sp. FL0916]
MYIYAPADHPACITSRLWLYFMACAAAEPISPSSSHASGRAAEMAACLGSFRFRCRRMNEALHEDMGRQWLETQALSLAS